MIVRSTRVIVHIFHVLHATQSSCTYASCKLTAILFQRRMKRYNGKACQQCVTKHMDTKKMAFCQAFAYSYSKPLWMTLYLTHLVTHCARIYVILQIAHKVLKFQVLVHYLRMIAGKMHSLHNKLRRRDVNMVGKRKQVHVSIIGLVRIRHET